MLIQEEEIKHLRETSADTSRKVAQLQEELEALRQVSGARSRAAPATARRSGCSAPRASRCRPPFALRENAARVSCRPVLCCVLSLLTLLVTRHVGFPGSSPDSTGPSGHPAVRLGSDSSCGLAPAP